LFLVQYEEKTDFLVPTCLIMKRREESCVLRKPQHLIDSHSGRTLEKPQIEFLMDLHLVKVDETVAGWGQLTPTTPLSEAMVILLKCQQCLQFSYPLIRLPLLTLSISKKKHNPNCL